MSKLDLVICSIPRMSLYYPPAAPALLKSKVQKAGFTCQTVDFTIRFHNRFFHTRQWQAIDNWLVVPNLYDAKVMSMVKKEVQDWAKDLVAMDPKWIGISVFSYESHKITKLLCLEIRRLSTHCRILLGGMGISDDAHGFAPKLKSLGLCDEYLLGDGEVSLTRLLQGEVNHEFHRLTCLDSQPFADWEDYNLDQYKVSKQRQNRSQKNKKNKTIWQGYGNTWYRSDEILTLPIVGSRGCVRKCKFCDIPHLWPKYKTRTAKNIAEEIILNYERYNVQRFHMTDSLINGSMKNFRELATILAEYRQCNKADFTITGQYIIRNADSETDEDYRNIAAAGFRILEVGIESGSQAVRYHMGKKFTNVDIDRFMERVHANGIMVVLLLIVGYPTETEEDFQATLDMLTRYRSYLQSGTVIEACLGGTLRIEPNTELSRDPNVEFLPNHRGQVDDLNWIYRSNPTLDLRERIRRRLVAMKHAQELGYLSPTNDQEILYLQSKWTEIQA